MEPDQLITVGYCKGELLTPEPNQSFANNIRQTYEEWVQNCPHETFQKILSHYEDFSKDKVHFPSTRGYESWLDGRKNLPKMVQITGAWAHLCVIGSTLESLTRSVEVMIDPKLIAMPFEMGLEEKVKMLQQKVYIFGDKKKYLPDVRDGMLFYKPRASAKEKPKKRGLIAWIGW